jgi:transcriptional regulator HMO1
VSLGINKLMEAFVSHTKNVLGEESADDMPNPSFGLFGTMNINHAIPEATVEAKKEKKKRAKKERDPDEPKRPLTAAFLFSQHARAIVKADLESRLPEGEKLHANAVNEEINKRWNAMDDAEKQVRLPIYSYTPSH